MSYNTLLLDHFVTKKFVTGKKYNRFIITFKNSNTLTLVTPKFLILEKGRIYKVKFQYDEDFNEEQIYVIDEEYHVNKIDYVLNEDGLFLYEYITQK